MTITHWQEVRCRCDEPPRETWRAGCGEVGETTQVRRETLGAEMEQKIGTSEKASGEYGVGEKTRGKGAQTRRGATEELREL